MSEELEYFKEDVNEQLQNMENALIDISSSGASDELIDLLFRAMHTIKGVSAMMDYSDIVSFTHIAESLLVQVREKTIKYKSSII